MRIKDLIPWANHRDDENRPSRDVHPLASLQRDMNRLFDDFWGRFEPREAGGPATLGVELAVADVVETDESIEVTVELPGLDEKDLDVSIAADALTIRGEKKVERQEEKKGFYLSERSYGSVFRSVPLPAGVDIEQADAKFANGVLSVTLPKSQEAQASGRKIQIKTA
ncbi:MAG: Hsp20/alpha crystallin family protein [Gammaproteobacteria bacterium]|nr:MAG: Hsp20/alpha crystallin family protein [Gammaproteobacteria bacterium]